MSSKKKNDEKKKGRDFKLIEGGLSLLEKKEKKSTEIIENALNRCLADGFSPYDPDLPDHPHSAVLETARRLGLQPDLLLQALQKGLLSPANDLYSSDKPHEDLISSMRAAGLEITSDDTARRHALRLTDEVKKLRKDLESIDRESLTAEDVRTKIFNLAAQPPSIPGWVTAPRLGGGGPGLPITIWSDWHYAEVIRKSQTSGTNAYNIAIADKRIELLVDRVCDITKNHQVSPDYSGIIVCLAGDLFSGDHIHEEIKDTNEEKMMKTFSLLQGRLIWSLRRLADEFGKVHVPCAFGNHARYGQQIRYKQSAETNYEFLLYNQLELFFKNDPSYGDRVTFQVSPENGVHFSVGKNKKTDYPGHRYYLSHGDTLGVKGGDGIIGPIGPIKRGDFKVRASEASIGRPYDTHIMGHWHQYMPLPGIIVNGTLKGWDEYARLALRAAYDHPAQALWFNHPLYGPVCHHKIILAETASPKNTPPSSDLFPVERPQKKSCFPTGIKETFEHG